MNAAAPSPLLRALSRVAAVLLIGAVLAYLIGRETPTGTVRGVAIMKETGRPLAGATVYLHPSGAFDQEFGTEIRPRERYVTTGEDGSFVLPRVPVGAYRLSAYGEHHGNGDAKTEVREGQTAAVRLAAKRNEPTLSLGVAKRVYPTRQTPQVTVRGYEDPAKAMRGDTLTVRVWRARLSTLLRDPAASAALQNVSSYGGQSKGRMPAALLRPATLPASDAPRLVAESEKVIRTTDREGFFNERLPIKTAGPGLYLVEVRHGRDAVRSNVLSTDMALVVKRTETQALAYAVGLEDGKPVAGAAVRHWRGGALLARATTDARGLADMDLPPLPRSASGEEGGSREARLLTVARRGEDEAAIGKDAWFSAEDAGGHAVHAYTDRTVYRPGHTVRYKAIVRRRNGATNRYTVPTGVPVSVEVRDPMGGRVYRTTATTNRWGTLDGAFDLSPEAPTGVYNLILEMGGERHTADVVVASYRKPEFAVTVTPAARHVVQGEDVSATVEAKYYFGSPVAGATVRYAIYREPDWSRTDPELFGADADPYAPEGGEEGDVPPGYDGESFYGASVAEGEATLDENGRATLTAPTERRRRAAGRAQDGSSNDDGAALDLDYTYTVTATVSEPSTERTAEGEAQVGVSAGSFSLSVSPDGYAATPGRAKSVVVRATDWRNRPVAGVEVTLRAAYERWDPKTGETRTEQLTPVKGRTGADGTVALSVTPPRAGSLTLTAVAYDDKERLLRARADLWAAGDSGADLGTEYADLALLTDKRRYSPGDTARVLVNSAKVGQTVLLTVEGDRVYRAVSVPIRKRSTVVALPIDAAWGPNVTLSACYVQGSKYATAEHALNVRLTDRALKVTVTPDRATYRPGDTAHFDVRVADASGRPVRCELSLSVVDEAIYALRRDDPRALWDALYPRRWSKVSTDYSFEVQYLGDGDKSEPVVEMRRTFRDTAHWEPRAETGADGTARVTVALPDNLTAWRATALVCAPDSSVGRGVATVTVAKPFFVRLDAPRFLTQTDEARLLALVHNETDRPQTAHVRLSAPGLLPGDGTARRDVELKAGEIAQLPFEVCAAAPGDVRVSLSAWTDAADERTGKPYTDGVEQTLPVRAWARERFTALAGVLGGDTNPSPQPPPRDGEGEPNTGSSSGTGTLLPPREAGYPRSGWRGGGSRQEGGYSDTRTVVFDPAAIVAESRLTLRVTPSVRSALLPALDYLVGFPYGCTEQTMSRFLPDLLLDGVRRETGRSLLSGPDAAAKTALLPRQIRDGITRLRTLQHGESGGWGWWENDRDDPFLTAYVLYGLSAARAAGYDPPDGTLENGTKAAREWVAGFDPAKPISGEDRAFLLYALAEAGDTGAAEPLRRFLTGADAAKHASVRLPRLDPDGLAYLTLAARRLGIDPAPAWNELQRRQVREGRLLHWEARDDRWTASDRMATAVALRALIAMNPADSRIDGVLRWLMAARTDGFWGDTRDTSWVLVAFADYLRARPADAAPASGTLAVLVNGREAARYDLAAESAERELLVRVSPSLLKAGANTVRLTVENGAGGTIYWSGGVREMIGAAEGGSLPAFTSMEGLTVKREYLRLTPEKADGSALWSLAARAVKGDRFTAGDSIRVRLTITAPREIGYVLIEDRFPAHLEVTQRGTAEEATEGTSGGHWYSHLDVRDDRIAVFAATLPKGKSVVEYNLRAQSPGVCRALPAQLQAMYDPTVRAESSDTRVGVGK